MKTRVVVKGLRVVFVGAILAVLLFPVYWMLVSSFKENSYLFSLPPHFSPVEGSIENYARVLQSNRHVTYFRNSMLVSSSTVVLSIVTSVLAGYALSRFTFWGKNLVVVAILSVQMFPVVAILISLYSFFNEWRLLNTYVGLVVSNTTFCLPLSIIMLKSYLDTVPVSLDEAARIDGCGRMRILRSVLMPTIVPGLLAVGTFTFLKSWDDFLFALIIMQAEARKTLPVGLAQSFLGEYVHDYGGMMAMSTCASLPVVLLFVFFQRYMISGMTAGAVKG
jgi:multiple sugar transport system permease protein